MSLVRYEPNSLLTGLRKQLVRLGEPDFFPALWEEDNNIATSSWMPQVDVKEENDRYVFLADIPGVNPKDIEVTSENGALTIKGERKIDKDEEREGYRRIERSRGSFYRRFNLPESVDTDKINARSNNGVLEITIPKTEKVKAKKIKVSG